MGDPLSTIKPAVRNLQAYTLKHFRAAVKVNQNENPFDMPEAVKRAVHQAVSRTAWCRYPDFVPASLISRLADFSHWKEDGVLVGNGSNELIEALMVVVVERGKRVVLPQPTFTLYGMFARILGGACRDGSPQTGPGVRWIGVAEGSPSSGSDHPLLAQQSHRRSVGSRRPGEDPAPGGRTGGG